MRLRSFVSSAAMAACLMMAPASANGESITFTGLSNASVVTLGGLYNGSVWAGSLAWKWNGAAPNDTEQSFYSYCVDLLRDLNRTQTTNIGNSSGLTGGSYVSAGGERAAWLFNTFASGIQTAGSALQAAALQVAIWEALYDSTLNLATGNVRLVTSGTIMNQAASYLSGLSAAAYQGSSTTVLFAVNGQSQIVNPVPEPSTLLLLGAGLFFLAWIARKRQPGASPEFR